MVNMDNNGFSENKCNSNKVELEMSKQRTENSVVTAAPNGSHTAPNVTVASGQKHFCEPELCQRLHGNKFVQKESNWHRWKTNFLLAIIGSFVLWLIAFFVIPLLI